MKHFARIALIIIAAYLIWLCIPKSCEPFGKYEQLGKKSYQSLLIDSIQKQLTLSVNKKSDSIVKIYKDSISKIHTEKEIISSKYYALRASVSKQRTVRVDSSNQVVSVPVIEYNASVNSGNLCDSLLMYQDQELAIKDSIISIQEMQIESNRRLFKTKDEALHDLIALNAEEKKQSEKDKKIIKRMPVVAALSAFAGSLITIILLK